MNDGNFTALVEFLVGERCTFFESEVRGGFGRCHVSAPSEELALQRIGAAMVQDGLALVQVQWCVENEGVEWDPPLRDEDLKNISDAQSSGEVIWSWFDVYTEGLEGA